ncbi:MAG: Ig-like domain-containing protein, partial [Mycobacterium sp.]|nr:Ig-like domain-containing protein [Mycobacterium sp.]
MTSQNSEQLVRRVLGIDWPRRFMLAVFLLVGAVGVLQLASPPSCPGSGCAHRVAAPKTLEPSRVTIAPGDHAEDVDPVEHVLVKADAGTLTEVRMVNENGKSIPGVMTPDAIAWKPTVPLGYGRTYTLTVSSRGSNGVVATQKSSFTTLRPSNQTKVSFTTTSEASLQDGGTYGVGTVIVAHFDEKIADRATAERHLTVTTDPPLQGSWFWVDDQHAHWRPEHYYPPGARVTADATIYGIGLGNGIFGQQDERVSFGIGDAHVSIADDVTKQVSVYDNGRLVRTMPTSMGMGGTEDVGGMTIN